MTKIAVAVVGALVLAPAVFAQAQERPDYSGAWALVEDRSAAGSRTFGKEFRVTQSPTTVTIERTTTMTSGAVPASLPGVSPPPAGAVGSTVPPTTYRATWMKGQLIIIRQTKMPSENNALMSVSRWALSLDADGSLVVDSLNVPMLPRANGPKQEPPVSVRSVYRKAQ